MRRETYDSRHRCAGARPFRRRFRFLPFSPRTACIYNKKNLRFCQQGKAGQRQKISAQDRKSFADEAVAFKDAGKEEPKGKGSGKPGGVTDQVLMSLVNKIDLLVSTLRTKHADATED